MRDGAVKALIDLYKFERVMAADVALAALLTARLPDLPASTVCTFVPASAAHRRQRGYDHMQRVVKKVAQKKSVQYAPLLRRRHDVNQRGHTRAERLRRQDGAFMAQQRDVTGPIVLIDDIYTTGGTLRAATKALREVYDQPIFVAVIARQPSKR